MYPKVVVHHGSHGVEVLGAVRLSAGNSRILRLRYNSKYIETCTNLVQVFLVGPAVDEVKGVSLELSEDISASESKFLEGGECEEGTLKFLQYKMVNYCSHEPPCMSRVDRL